MQASKVAPPQDSRDQKPTWSSFGASAPYADLAEHFGFTAKSVADRVKAAV